MPEPLRIYDEGPDDDDPVSDDETAVRELEEQARKAFGRGDVETAADLLEQAEAITNKAEELAKENQDGLQ